MQSETGAGPAADEALALLSDIVPFRYLKAAELEALAADAALRSYAPGEVLIEQGDSGGDEVFVLLSGSVESVDLSRNPPFRMNVVEAGSYFGERSCLFGSPRLYEMRALAPSACLAIPGGRFLRLLAESRTFAQAFGVKLREGLGIFDAFDRFTAEVLRGADLGHLEVRRLTELYKALEPALHPLASDEARIDWGALSYAVRRLPGNVTRTFLFLLTDNLPTVYASPSLLFPFVETEARHRFVYEMMPGKDMVLVRNGMSDLMDFVTCLCLLAVEGRKLRYRLNHPDLILALSRCGGPAGDASAAEGDAASAAPAGAPGGDASAAEGEAAGVVGNAVGVEGEAACLPEASGPDEGELLSKLPFSEAERRELEELWPGRAAERVRELV
ncbi:MAG TPA: cyclic nucleotide-binding domain-containing protein, partial [Spirochaetales bacterium]|nr:cyclic nucleotide-binding domain-containing protein [Spirochaetales bacterium]